uniref:Patatin n=1 Tax=Rhizophora mucronata TaxID=61149 RepID=A0A2P2MT77_RHIMU
MAASLFSFVTHSHASSSFPSPVGRLSASFPPLRQTLTFPAKCSDGNGGKTSNATTEIPPPPSDEKKSFAVATGELFLGITSRLLLRRSGSNRSTFSTNDDNSKKNSNSSSAGTSSLLKKLKLKWKSNYDYDYEKDRIGAVIEDEIEAAVIWEQRVKDVEAEKERCLATSPGFSFSAAGLLFPYHLGVAQCLIEKGYIKEMTPLAGSSAGAIVCAVIASGASMEEALKATKILADNCRLKGTAFRLGAVLRDVLENFLPDNIHIRSNGRVRGEDDILSLPVSSCLNICFSWRYFLHG